MNKAAVILTILLLLSLPTLAQSGCTTNKPDKTNQIAVFKPYDISDVLEIMLAAESGGGFSGGPRQPAAYAGVRMGIENYVLNLGYDRLRAHDGFATQLSRMVPAFRVPGPQENKAKNYVRVYLEPGIGYRTGGGGFGGYLSGGVMAALLSDKRLGLMGLSPYIEYQRRVPFSAPGRGDNRFTFGVMLAAGSN